MSKKFKLIVDMLPNLDVLREVANCKQKTGQKTSKKTGQPRRRMFPLTLYAGAMQLISWTSLWVSGQPNQASFPLWLWTSRLIWGSDLRLQWRLDRYWLPANNKERGDSGENVTKNICSNRMLGCFLNMVRIKRDWFSHFGSPLFFPLISDRMMSAQ